MKLLKRVAAFSLLCAMTVPTVIACGGGGGNGGDTTTKIKTISSTLLDGKVANLMSANAIGIEDKNQSVSPMKKSSGGLKTITASADGETAKQAKNELVKETEDGLEDVRFHDGANGGYRQWNQKFNNHHHRGEECKNANCDEISDEIEAEEAEENTPTVISLDARVNKLYNAGKFTFMSVSSAVEGDVQVLSQIFKAGMGDGQLYSYAVSGTYPTLINLNEHYKNKESLGENVLTYMTVKSGNKQGMILVKRSEAEIGYHYANYWCDDFNQSYLIDNETGKTYSLSEIPYIYSVKNGLIQVWDNTVTHGGNILDFDFYKPQIVDGELVLNKLEITHEPNTENPYNLSRPLADKYGNVVFATQGVSYANGDAQFGEVKGNGYILAGYSSVVYEQITRTFPNPSQGQFFARKYTNANRYQLGKDGLIYRFDYRGDMNKIPVAVLNENCEWTEVPQTTDVTFPDSAFMVDVSTNASRMQYLCPTRIANGKTFFANACLGSEYPFTANTDPSLFEDSYIGIAALPTTVNENEEYVGDTAIREFMTLENAGNMGRNDIAFRVGTTAFAYFDKVAGDLVIWDRLTETKKTIKGTELSLDKEHFKTCFKAVTESGTYYVSYYETNPTKEWTEYSTTPIVQTLQLDAYYEFLNNKLS